MYRVLISAFLIAMAPVTALSQSCGTRDLIAELTPTERAELDALVAGHPYARGLLFEARKGEASAVVAGTIHIPDPRLVPMVDRLRPKLEQADLLIIEATSEDEAGIQSLAASKPGMFFITEGPTMIDLLEPEEWAAVNERLTALGIPSFMAAKFQPWYLNMTLAIPPCAMAAIQSGEKGLDRQLEALANAKGVAIASLDDTEAVLRLFADEPLEVQLDGLRITLETQEDGNASTSTLIEAYFDGRIRESWEFGRIQVERSGIENGAEMFEEVNQTLLIERNQSWEAQLSALVEGKNVVIAVGAAHLSGETGVLRALERLGYTISPL